MTMPNRSRATAFGIKGEREESGAYPIGSGTDLSEQLESDAVIAELAPELVSLIPEPPPESMRPRAATPSERAELVFEDLSLSLDNPYLASSLVPPPKRPFAIQRALAIAGGMLAAAGLGAALQFSALRGAPDVSVQKSQSSAGISAPAPVAVASPRELIAPPSALVPPPPVAVVSPTRVAEVAAPAVATPVPVEAPVRTSAPSATLKPKDAPPAPMEPATVAAPMPVKPAAVAPVEEAAAPLAPAEEAAAVPVDLPAYPTREQVTAGFEAVRAALAQCAAGRTGTAEIKATINSNGRIGHAVVAGDFRGTAEGSCIAKAVRDAQFPAFAEPRLKVSYPFAL
jgi:hypothetical protein